VDDDNYWDDCCGTTVEEPGGVKSGTTEGVLTVRRESGRGRALLNRGGVRWRKAKMAEGSGRGIQARRGGGGVRATTGRVSGGARSR
jgi:hypothetical protein